jgi:hypothetical protein
LNVAKRISGPPRRPRNPVAKAVRTPQYRMRVVADKRERERLRQAILEQTRPQKRDEEKD